jgi:adenine-specific DNA-methyltransferase
MKYGLVFEHHPATVRTDAGETLTEGDTFDVALEHVDSVRGKDPKGPEHILVEADNYIALKYMQYTHAGQIDVIYIDPPYNTGAKDWKYNNDYVDSEDQFRHSKWLSFMEKRLRLAKRLLKPDGVLICAIDHNEIATLTLLLTEIFRGAEIVEIVVQHNPRGIQGDNFSYCHEYMVYVIPKKGRIYEITRASSDKSPLRKWGGESTRATAKNCFFPIRVKGDRIIGIGQVAGDSYHPKRNRVHDTGEIDIWPIDMKGVERKWRYSCESIKDIMESLSIKTLKDGSKDVEITKTRMKPKTIWAEPEMDSSSWGTQTVNRLIPKGSFNFPKSIHLVKRALSITLPNDGICLDFFAGSGTTFQAVAELNEADGGTRQCILVTNNESNICRDVTWERMKRVTAGTHDYPECTKKYDGCPLAHASYYVAKVQSGGRLTVTAECDEIHP